jgi:chitinase
MKKKVVFLLIFILTILNPLFSQKNKSDFNIVGYYSMRSVIEGYKKFPFKNVTHANLFFLNPDSVGNYTQDFTPLKSFVKKAHKKGILILFSIGGGGKHPYYHRLMQDDMRGTIVNKLIELVNLYNLDGIDNDLEGSDIDENYEDFVVELGTKLKEQSKLFTAAVVVSDHDPFTDKALSQYDFVNIMSYDHTGPWRPEKPGPHSSYEDAINDLDYFGNKRGIAAEKMMLGVPFYGYGFGPELTSKAKTMNYKQIVETYPGTEMIDEKPIEDGKIMYYNGIPTIRKKTELAMQKAGGIMIWQLGGDAKGKKSLLKVINETAYKK